MKIVRSIAQLRLAVARAKEEGSIVGFVPTMGFLHEGHLSLVDVARANGATFVVVSIFVNPTQFGPREDFAAYPRNEDGDIELLEGRRVDLLFAPTPQEIYPDGFATTVHVSGVSEPLEGSRRPGHFDGVATVVLKLFGMVVPDVAVFGRKDAQQCAVVERLVRDLDIPVRLLFGETVREADGLAMSSRNAYLLPSERAVAPALHQALRAGADLLRDFAGDVSSVSEVMRQTLSRNPDVELDYLELVDPATFAAPEDLHRDLLLVGAVQVGKTRLIDNILIPHSSGASAQIDFHDSSEQSPYPLNDEQRGASA